MNKTKPKYKLISEQSDRFVVEGKGGKQFILPKRGMGDKLMKQVRGYAGGGPVSRGYAGPAGPGHHSSCIAHGGTQPCDHPNCCAEGMQFKAQGGTVQCRNPMCLCLGGKVERHADGGEVPAGAGNEQGYDPGLQPPVVVNVNAQPQPPDSSWTDMFRRTFIEPGPARPDPGQSVPAFAGNDPYGDPVSPPAVAPVAPPMAPSHIVVPPLVASHASTLPTPPMAVSHGPPAPLPAAPQQGGPQPASYEYRSAEPRPPDYAAQISSSYADMAGRVQALGSAQAVASATLGAAQERAADLQQQQIQAAQDNFKKNMALVNQAYDYVKNARVDPNHFWNSKSTGDQISTAIGVLISGIGAGLSRTSNMAMDQINRAIDRDIDAQKTNIGNQWNALRFMTEQTHDQLTAELLLSAQQKAAAQGMIEAQATKLGGPIAQQQAALAASQLGVSAAKDAQEAAARQAQLQMVPLQRQALIGQITGQSIQNAAGALDLQFRQQMRGQLIGNGQGRNPQAAQAWQGAQGVQGISPNGVAYGSSGPAFTLEDHQKRLVTLPDGRQLYADTPEDAQELKKSLPAQQETLSILQQLKSIGRYGVAAVPGHFEDYNNAQQLRSRLSMTVARALVGRVSQGEINQIQDSIAGGKFMELVRGGALYDKLYQLTSQGMNNDLNSRAGIMLPLQQPINERPWNGGR